MSESEIKDSITRNSIGILMWSIGIAGWTVLMTPVAMFSTFLFGEEWGNIVFHGWMAMSAFTITLLLSIVTTKKKGDP